MWKIDIYQKENGEMPLQDFLKLIDSKMKAKFLQELELLKEYGNRLREPYSKALEKGIFELRIKQGTNISRVFYFFFKDKIIILTNGFIKKSQKTPKIEVIKALKYKTDYERRYKNEV